MQVTRQASLHVTQSKTASFVYFCIRTNNNNKFLLQMIFNADEAHNIVKEVGFS